MGCWCRVLPHSVIIYLNLSSWLSLEHWLSNLLVISSSLAWRTSQSSSSMSPTSLTSLTSPALCTSLTLTTGWHSLSLLLTQRCLSQYHCYFHISSNSKQQVLEEHCGFSASVHIVIDSSKSSFMIFWLWHMYKFSSSTSCHAVSVQWLNVCKLWLRKCLNYICTVAQALVDHTPLTKSHTQMLNKISLQI